jgi:hypothetical protein
MQPDTSTNTSASDAAVKNLREWYLGELKILQDEVAELRCLQFQDRQKIEELIDLVRAVLGVVDGTPTIQ